MGNCRFQLSRTDEFVSIFDNGPGNIFILNKDLKIHQISEDKSRQIFKSQKVDFKN